MNGSAGGRQFPRLETCSLNGQALLVPRDLPRPGLLVLAFRRGQQAHVDAWRASTTDDPVLGAPEFWEVPVIGRGWAPARGWIDGGMTRAIRDADVRDHTITAYTDVRRVCRALGVVGTGQVVPVLVAGGQVRWQGAGPPRPEQLEGLRAACAALGTGV